MWWLKLGTYAKIAGFILWVVLVIHNFSLMEIENAVNKCPDFDLQNTCSLLSSLEIVGAL